MGGKVWRLGGGVEARWVVRVEVSVEVWWVVRVEVRVGGWVWRLGGWLGPKRLMSNRLQIPYLLLL